MTATPRRGTSQRLHVLVLENDSRDAELAVLMLQHAGFDVASDLAVDEQEFRKRLRSSEYDLVLADYRLPTWTGMDALAVIKERGLDIPLILVTGTLGDERAVECVKEGAADYVIKHNLGRLPLAVRRALDEKQSRAAQLSATREIRKLSLAVDQSPASVLITSTDGVIVYVNRTFERITGYSASEAIGQNPRLLKSGENPPELYRELWACLRAGRVWRGQLINRRKNGDRFWDSVTISPMYDETGVVTNYLAIQEDVTERRRTEAALGEREERFRQLAENMEEVFFVLDSQFREVHYISPAYEKIWGRSCRDLYENPRAFLEPVLPEDRERLLHSIAANQRGVDSGKIEFRIVQPNGQVRWVLAHAVPIRNDRGEVYRISGVALDVTEHRAAEEALAQSESRFRTLVEASFDAIEVTERGVIRDVNQGFLQMFDCTREEAIGRPALDFVAEESLDIVRQRVAREAEGRYEVIGKRRDGRKVVLEVAAKMQQVGGRVERVAALRDITELRTLEEQFRQAQKMDAVGQLAGGVAHDFNNLLTVITSYTSMMLEDMSARDPRRDDLEQIRKAASDAANLTRQLLAFSRQQVIKPRLVALENVVRGMEKMLRRLIVEDVELVTALSATPSSVIIDAGQLEQVIINLAVNARDAMPDGGRLTIETSVAELDDNYARTHWPSTPGRFAMLAVSDTGIGMDETTRARIFEPFFTTKELGKGTGLGLATVYGIVKQSGGFIWVYSEPGRGTTFKIYLPLAETAESLDGETPAATPPPGGMESVLLVEDSAAVRDAAREILQRNGYRVIAVPNADAAIAVIANQPTPIHLLLTDVVMPGLNGRQLAEQLTRQFPELRVLYMSGYTDDAVVRRGLLTTDLAYLQKPFTPDVLARKVREVLDAIRDPR